MKKDFCAAHRKRGISLMELIAAMFIIAALGLVATPIVGDLISDANAVTALHDSDSYCSTLSFMPQEKRQEYIEQFLMSGTETYEKHKFEPDFPYAKYFIGWPEPGPHSSAESPYDPESNVALTISSYDHTWWYEFKGTWHVVLVNADYMCPLNHYHRSSIVFDTKVSAQGTRPQVPQAPIYKDDPATIDWMQASYNIQHPDRGSLSYVGELSEGPNGMQRSRHPMFAAIDMNGYWIVLPQGSAYKRAKGFAKR